MNGLDAPIPGVITAIVYLTESDRREQFNLLSLGIVAVVCFIVECLLDQSVKEKVVRVAAEE